MCRRPRGRDDRATPPAGGPPCSGASGIVVAHQPSRCHRWIRPPICQRGRISSAFTASTARDWAQQACALISASSGASSPGIRDGSAKTAPRRMIRRWNGRCPGLHNYVGAQAAADGGQSDELASAWARASWQGLYDRAQHRIHGGQALSYPLKVLLPPRFILNIGVRVVTGNAA